MNERIQEFWEQASIRYSVYETLKPAAERKIIPDIFAELIVKETMQVVANNLPQNTYLDVADAVIEHFKE